MNSLFLAFIAFWLALLPVYLWWYWLSVMAESHWSRSRFLVGMLIGWFSVLGAYVLAYIPDAWVWRILLLVGVFVVLYIGICIATFFGSTFARGFLRQAALLNITILFCVLISVIGLLGLALPGEGSWQHLIVALVLSAFFEESLKHLSGLGLIGYDFSFSKKDIVFLVTFVVLGFTFSENLLYLFHADFALGTWIFRSFFTIFAHIFIASICTFFWWKALSYNLFSWRYIVTFAFGFFVACIVHVLYNYFLEKSMLLWVLGVCIFGYIFFISAILPSSRSQ